MIDMAVRLDVYSKFFPVVMDMQIILLFAVIYMNLELCELGIENYDNRLHIQKVNIQSFILETHRKVEQHAPLTEELHILLFHNLT